MMANPLKLLCTIHKNEALQVISLLFQDRSPFLWINNTQLLEKRLKLPKKDKK
jgi:hypothetical protein